ncbi:MAG: Uma2 family endonuclease [Bacteroidota bacterium]|nr:Uma2 family endonuclease [Candidatus Kapabacteria bacterium]MDW8220597.1 Uma2 family endonuclease [Bacteroidota bacterium]
MSIPQHTHATHEHSTPPPEQIPAEEQIRYFTNEELTAHIPDLSTLITEDDTPVDNLFSAKQQRLLVETLHGNVELWNPSRRSFVVDANVGIFPVPKNTPLVPDVFLSMDVLTDDIGSIHTTRAYFAWVYGKMPELVIEIVSNRKGGEMERKHREYARQHIPYYAVFDPMRELRGEIFQLFALYHGAYTPLQDFWMEDLNLGLRLWHGVYEGEETTWLRWCDAHGTLIPTTAESRDYEKQRAEQERQRAERLAEQLRRLGITPDV